MSTRGFTIVPPAADAPDASLLPGEPSPRPADAYPIGWDDCIGGLSADECPEAAESPDQSDIIEVVRSSLQVLARRRGWVKGEVYIGSDTYFCWVPGEPRMRVSPDVYLLDHPPEGPRERAWETWRPGHRPPRWALEVVSRKWTKDYELAPIRYGALGCQELVLFDPALVLDPPRRPNRDRAVLSILKLSAPGRMEPTYRGPGPGHSEQLGCWLQPGRAGYVPMLRLSEDGAGHRVIPTEGEQAALEERARREAESGRELEAKARREAESGRDLEAKARRQAERERDELEKRLRELQARGDGPKGRRW